MMHVRTWIIAGFAAIAAIGTALLLSAAAAQAGIANFTYSKSFAVGGVESVEAIAVDETNGYVYVYNKNNEAIDKFDDEGNPVNFSALGSNAIKSENFQGFAPRAQLAVDNSSGPAAGDIYFTAGRRVEIFAPNGIYIGTLEYEGDTYFDECGVAVAGDGDVYVVGGDIAKVFQYRPSSNPVTVNDFVRSFSTLPGEPEPCHLAVDREGSVYTATYERNGGPIVKFAGTEESLVVPEGPSPIAAAGGLAGELFVGYPSEVRQYDSGGALLSTLGVSGPGAITSSTAIAVYTKAGRLFVSTGAGKEVEIWQGARVPSAQTGGAANLSAAGTATLNGEAEATEKPIESCLFEYGLSAAYGAQVACAQSMPLTNSVPTPVSVDLSGVELDHLYHYRLRVAGEDGTSYGRDHTFAILVLPTVNDRPPVVSAITRSSALLTGTINPEQGDTTYHFEYGTTESYGADTPLSTVGEGTLGDLTVNQQISGLSPDTEYHYRLVARNLAGRQVGLDQTFTTAAPTPPTARTGGASGVAQNTATIGATIDTKGLPTSYGFEIGTSTDYGPPTGLGSVGAGLSETPVALALSGLLPGTTYHYRITATNVDGTSYGADQTFTTGVFASTFATPPAPLPFVAVPAFSFPAEATATKITAKKKAARKKRAAKKRKRKRHSSRLP